VACAVFCTFGIQFYVCLEIVWNAIEGKSLKNPMLANYGLRTGLVIAILMLAVVVPSIAPFISLVGAFCCSTLGLILPVRI
jgi:solute carrier family 36 (proton-coupled amino acid transporter)